MLVNSKDLVLTLNAFLLNYKLSPKTVAATRYKKLVLRKEYQDNILDLEFYIKASSYNAVYEIASNLIKELTECTIKFDDMKNFNGSIVTHNLDKFIQKKKQILKVQLVGDCYDDEISITANRVLSKTLNISGNDISPAIVEITPSINLINLTVTGFTDSFTIRNLTANQKVIVNGEDGIVTQNGVNKFLDWDGWEFPNINPGSNTITFSQSSCDITIKYKPRWI